MRLVVDACGLQSESRFRGIGRYTRGLVEGLAKNTGEHEVWIALNANLPQVNSEIVSHFDGLISPDRIVEYAAFENVNYMESANDWSRRSSEILREHFIAGLEPDVVLMSSMVEGFADNVVTSCGSILEHIPSVGVAFDLIPLLSPETYLAGARVHDWYMEKIAALKRCNALLSISESAAREFTSLLDLPSQAVTNISTAADQFAALQVDPNDFQNVAQRLRIRLPYFVYAASFESRKNFDTLVEAFAKFQASAETPHQLVLVTQNNSDTLYWQREHMRRFDIPAGSLILTGHISDEELKLLFSNALAMVYPSKHEGFGLPILEAMHCGVPVIGSDISSIPEIISMADAMFEPMAVDSIAEMMLRITEDHRFRARLTENAIARRKLFTWDKTAKTAWTVLDKLHEDTKSASRMSRSDRYHLMIAKLKALTAQSVTPSADQVRKLANKVAENLETLDGLPILSPAERGSWKIEGPFDSTYSLALINREIARALSARGEHIVLHSTDGPGDYSPNEDFLRQAHPDIHELWQKGPQVGDRPDIVSRNLYPPRVDDMQGRRGFLHSYAWEESGFPSEWVEQFNLHLDGITCLSHHVRKVLLDNGVAVPLEFAGCGVDHWERIEPNLNISFPGNAFRFLHVSSCFPRKGPRALVEAYGKAFRRNDDVSLLIKTFANPHNEIEIILQDLRDADPDYPEVELITEDLSDSDLKALYMQADVLVAPSHAEGYGLPLAEAMLSGLPVITTAWSGQLDFCNETNAWLVDYDFEPAKSHFNLPGSVWARPRVGDLAGAMRDAHSTSAKQRRKMAADGRALLLKEHKWSDVADRLVDSVDAWSVPRTRKPVRLGMVTTWNTRCGIATYAEHLTASMSPAPIIYGAKNDDPIGPDDPNLRRSWEKDSPDAFLEQLEKDVISDEIECLVIQFNFYFFDFKHFATLLQRLKAQGVTVILIMHATSEPPNDATKRLSTIKDALSKCDRLLVHSYHDLNRLKTIGLIDNVALFPHGMLRGYPADFSVRSNIETFRIASFGFCLPHKGLPNLVRAFGILSKQDPSLRLELVNAEYPADNSRDLIAQLRDDISWLGLADKVELIADFLSDDEALKRLRSSNLIVFPYEQTAESASGAIRIGLASGQPVARSKLPIFQDVETITFPIDSIDASSLARSLQILIAEIRDRTPGTIEIEVASATWRRELDYERLAARLQNMAVALVQQNSTSKAWGQTNTQTKRTAAGSTKKELVQGFNE